MSKETYLPESMLNIDLTMTYEKLSFFYESYSSVTGNVIRLNVDEELLYVDLGGGIIGIMPFTEATIYSIRKNDGTLSPNITHLTRKTIQAKIKNFKDNTIILSRKDNMLDALEVLKQQTKIESAKITGLSSASAFIDIGAGIIGRSSGRHFSPTIYRDVKDTGIHVGDTISVMITEFLEDKLQFELSRVAAIPPVSEIYKENTFVDCKVFDPVENGKGIGYYVTFHNNDFCGIVDSRNVELHYGDEIEAVIKRIVDDKPRLQFIALKL